MSLQHLIELCARRWPTEGESALDRVCAEHPEHAEALRREWRTLERLGTLRSEYGIEAFDGLDRDDARTAVRVDLPCSIGRFRAVEELGRGGCGVVYRAVDEDLERTVALKLLYADVGQDAEIRTRFRDEARTLAALHHPHIATIHSIETHEGLPYLVLEYVPGETLRTLFDRSAIGVLEFARLGSAVASAIAAAHEAGVVHRDLKPANVIVPPDGIARVLDFGLAARLRGTSTSTSKSTPDRGSAAEGSGASGPGTARYMSPQQWDSDAPAPADDVWSLGCVLFEGFGGGLAIAGDDLATVEVAGRAGDYDLGRLPASTPGPVRSLIDACLAHSRADRPSARECTTILEEVAAGLATLPRIHLRTLRRAIPEGESVPFLLRWENRASDPLQGTLYLEEGRLGAERRGRKIHWAPGEEGSEVFLAPLPVEDPWSSPRARLELDPDCAAALGFDEILSDSAASVRRRASLPPPITGEPERDRAERSLVDTVARGEARVVAVVGPEGSGRSTLLARAVGAWPERGVRVLSVRAASARGVADRVLRELLREFLGLALHATSPIGDRSLETRRRAAADLGRTLGSEPHTMATLLGWAFDEPMDGVTPELRHLHWRRWLEGLARDGVPTTLVIDDLDPTDSDLSSLIEAWRADPGEGTSAVSIVIALSSREEVAKLPVDRTIEVPPIGVATIARAIAERYPGVGVLDALPWLPAALVAETEGVLGRVRAHLEELSTPGSPTQILDRVEHRWELIREVSEEAFRRSIPEGEDPRLARRLDSLSPEARRVLESAALIGPQFPVAVLERSRVGEESETLDDTLDTLEHEGFIEAQDPSLSWARFRDPRLARVIVEKWTERERRTVARRASELAEIAIALVGEPERDGRQAEGTLVRGGAPGGAEEHGTWIGDLERRAGKPASALEWWCASLEQAIGRGEYGRSVPLLERIDALLGEGFEPGPTARLTIERGRARTLLKLGHHGEARTAIEAAVTAAELLDDPTALLDLLLLAAENAIRRQDLEAADRAIARAVAHGEKGRPGVPPHPDLENLRGILQLVRGELPAAEHTFRALLARARHTGDPYLEAKALTNLGSIDLRHSALEVAQDEFRRAAILFERGGNLDHATAARVWLANVALKRGRLSEAEDGYLRALTVQRHLQNRAAIAQSRGNIALVLLLAGRLGRAIEAAREARESARSVGDGEGLAKAGIVLAECCAQLGDRKESFRILGEVAGEAERSGASAWEEHARLLEIIGRRRGAADGETIDPELLPRSGSLATRALRLLVAASSARREPTEALPEGWLIEAESLLEELADPSYAELRLQLEAALARTRFDSATAKKNRYAAIDRLRDAIAAPWVLPGCDRHAACQVLEELLREFGSWTEADQRRTEGALREQAEVIEDPELRRRYLTARAR